MEGRMGSAPSSATVSPAAGVWALMNRARPIEPRVVRIGCLLLAVVYALMAVLRHDPDHPSFAWVRGAIALQGLAGVVLAERLSFAGIRVYSVVLAFMLSLGGGWVAAALGNDPRQLPLTGLCTFVALAFLQTGIDVAIVAPALVLGHALLLLWMPPEHVALASVIVMVGSSIATGAMTSLLVVSYSARLHESLRSWREACERERGALRAKNEFLNTMSHELRSPLHVIIGYADIVREDAQPALDAPLDRIRESAIELLQLVENTMKAARLESGRLQIHLATFDPSALLRELADDVAALPEAKTGVPVRWRVPADLPAVCLDRLKLKEIVQNLVSNALKFTRAGDVTVEASSAGDTLHIEVSDTGPGIPAEAQDRIFEMFERVGSRGDDGPPGVGLGLYIARNLVGLMGGKIGVESEPGVGTRFAVDLPLAAPRDAAAAAAAA